MIARVIHIEGDNTSHISELDSFGIDYKVFNGIVKPNAFEGVSESFKQIIRESKDLDYVFIFEDDVKFTSKHSRDNWEICKSKLPEDWDILLGGSYQYDLHPEQPEDKALIRLADFSSLHCVLINAKCFEHIILHDTTQVPHIDRWLGRLAAENKIKVYLCNPQIAIQHNGFSRTRGKDVNYDHLLTDKNILHD